MFSGLNLYPWSPTVVTGKRSVQIVPIIKDIGKNYAYDIFVELVSGVAGSLKTITHKGFTTPDLDSGVGGNVNKATFTY